MKKTKILFIAAVSAILGLSACSGTPAGGSEGESGQQSQQQSQAAQEAIKVEGLPKTVFKGDEFDLTASVEGVTWKSSDETVATVDEKGHVKALKDGSATITANKEGYKEGKVTVRVQLVGIKITAADNKTTLIIDETVQLTAAPINVSWKSSDEKVATVDEKGVVKAIAPGTATITGELDGFKAGTISITVTRPAANAVFDFTVAADHYSADGWWSITTNTFGMSMETGGGATPVTHTQSWGQETESDTYIGAFGEGDIETIKFNSDKAAKGEFVLNVGNSDAVVLKEVMDIKLNDKEVSLEGIELAAHEGQWGNSLEFGEISLGTLDIAKGENTLEFRMKNEAAPYLNELAVFAGDAKIELVPPQPKESVVVEATELEVIEGETVAITSQMEGLSYVSVDPETATVDEKGVVTGVKVGITNITVRKEGMYSVRVKITVNPKPVEGQILLEAELGTGAENYNVTRDGSGFGGNTVHSGGAYLAAWQADSIELSFTFEAKAGTAELSVVGSAPMSFGGDAADFVFADSVTMKLNGQDIPMGEGKFTAPQGMVFNAPMEEVVIGNVTLVEGENTLEVVFTGTPSLDVFKLTPLK